MDTANREFYTVYCAINTVNGKSFVGVDSDWPKARIAHESARGDSHPFHRAIRQYGAPLFRWNLMLQTRDAEEASRYSMAFLVGTITPNGYNIGAIDLAFELIPETPVSTLTAGLNGTTAEDVVKVAKPKAPAKKRSRLGMKHTEETKKKIAAAKKAKGTKLTDEQKAKIVAHNYLRREVVIEGKTYMSRNDAARSLGIKSHQVDYVVNGTNTIDHYKNLNAQSASK